MIFFEWKNGISDIDSCFLIRKKVFISEQGFSSDNEFDDIDKAAWHLLMKSDNKPIGTLRLFKEDGGFHVGRICMLKEHRGNGNGKAILKKAEEKALELGATELALSAQVRVADFYEKCGYVKQGKEYLDEFCPHIKMVKKLCD